jgi:hypothetical protein
MRLFAYLDPGSAGVMLQALLGGAAAALVSIKMFGKRVFRTLMFWKKFDDEDEPKGTTSTSAATKHDDTPTAAQNEATRSAAEHETEKEPV